MRCFTPFTLRKAFLSHRFFSTSCIRHNTKAPPLSNDEMDKLVKLIENDPRILMEMIRKLEPQNRRRMIVAGGAMEWFGKENAAQEIEKADQDNDRYISPKDFDHWLESALKRRSDKGLKKGTDPAFAYTASSTKDVKDFSVPFSTLFLIALEAGLPFVGFGFLDNAAMILAGDAIDGTLGFYLNCSVLASAAMGNIFSGTLGMQVHGLIERVVQKFNFEAPVLTAAQMKNRKVFYAGHLGGTIGIAIGLCLGMLPLLFITSDESEKNDFKMFQKWDTNKSGKIDLPEFEHVLMDLGLEKSKQKATMVMEKYGTNMKINFEQFCELRKDLSEGKPIFKNG